jgi:transposase
MSTPSDPSSVLPLGVGLDTARYGHHATFLHHDLRLACPPLDFTESAQGYQLLYQRLHLLQQRFASVHFHIRVDVAGQYATNLEAFLRGLPWPLTLSLGEPTRNARYRQALFPKRKADPAESYAAARFAIREQPQHTPALPAEVMHLRETVQALESQVRQSTRLNNQLHNLLARVFPELATLVPTLQRTWILEILEGYPSPQRLAQEDPEEIAKIPFVGRDKLPALQQAASTTIGSFHGNTAEHLVRRLVGQLRRSLDDEESLRKRLAALYRQLPQHNHLDSIPGIGVTTAAVLTAKIGDIERFAQVGQLISYFGVFAEENASGMTPQGQRRPGRSQYMSRKGNDLARKYLFNAAKVAIRYNPAVRALYERQRARGKRGDVALGHGMRKLVQLLFAVWKTGRPFDGSHHRWQGAEGEEGEGAAGHTPSVLGEVSGHRGGPSIPAPSPAEKGKASSPEVGGGIDYAALRAQLSMAGVLAELSWLDRLVGRGQQKRGRCPIHARDGQGPATFSVHLGKGLFRCFASSCAAQGNMLDLWAAVHKQPLYEAALELAARLGVAVPRLGGTEKRNP